MACVPCLGGRSFFLRLRGELNPPYSIDSRVDDPVSFEAIVPPARFELATSRLRTGYAPIASRRRCETGTKLIWHQSPNGKCERTRTPTDGTGIRRASITLHTHGVSASNRTKFFQASTGRTNLVCYRDIMWRRNCAPSSFNYSVVKSTIRATPCARSIKTAFTYATDMAGERGFEPLWTGSEPGILPLDDSPMG